MKIITNDQIHISAVQNDTLRPGQEFIVSDSLGNQLLQAHPYTLRKTGNDQPAPAAEYGPVIAKAEPAPKNKAERKPKNKSAK